MSRDGKELLESVLARCQDRYVEHAYGAPYSVDYWEHLAHWLAAEECARLLREEFSGEARRGEAWPGGAGQGKARQG